MAIKFEGSTNWIEAPIALEDTEQRNGSEHWIAEEVMGLNRRGKKKYLRTNLVETLTFQKESKSSSKLGQVAE